MSLEFEFHLEFHHGSLSTELSDFWQSARSRNEHKTNIEKHVPRVMTSLLMSFLPISILQMLTILMQTFKFQRWVASSPSFCRPVARAPWRACLQASFYSKVNILMKFFHKEVKWKWSNISALQCNVMYVKQKKGQAWNLLSQEVALTLLNQSIPILLWKFYHCQYQHPKPICL